MGSPGVKVHSVLDEHKKKQTLCCCFVLQCCYLRTNLSRASKSTPADKWARHLNSCNEYEGPPQVHVVYVWTFETLKCVLQHSTTFYLLNLLNFKHAFETLNTDNLETHNMYALNVSNFIPTTEYTIGTSILLNEFQKSKSAHIFD